MKKMVLSLCAAASLLAAPAWASQAAEQLQRKLNGVLPLSAGFSQEVTDSSGQLLQTAQGEALITDGGRFRWETFSPDENLVVSNGETVWLYNPFVEQVTIMDLQQAIENTPALLLSTRSEAAWAKYTIEKSGNGFMLRPKDEGSMIEWLELTFSGNNLVALDIKDIQGQISKVYFESQALKQNTSFEFTVPEFADVEDLRK